MEVPRFRALARLRQSRSAVGQARRRNRCHRGTEAGWVLFPRPGRPIEQPEPMCDGYVQYERSVRCPLFPTR
jgi:hypothetical protein